VKCGPKTILFFWTIQRMYMRFVASPTKCQILTADAPYLTPTPLCNIRWECWVESVKAIQGVPCLKPPKNSVTRKRMSCKSWTPKFLTSLSNSWVVWLLVCRKTVSRTLQSNTRQLDMGLTQIKAIVHFLQNTKKQD
jgi:hypothetical protein